MIKKDKEREGKLKKEDSRWWQKCRNVTSEYLPVIFILTEYAI